MESSASTGVVWMRIVTCGGGSGSSGAASSIRRRRLFGRRRRRRGGRGRGDLGALGRRLLGRLLARLGRGAHGGVIRLAPARQQADQHGDQRDRSDREHRDGPAAHLGRREHRLVGVERRGAPRCKSGLGRGGTRGRRRGGDGPRRGRVLGLGWRSGDRGGHGRGRRNDSGCGRRPARVLGLPRGTKLGRESLRFLRGQAAGGKTAVAAVPVAVRVAVSRLRTVRLSALGLRLFDSVLLRGGAHAERGSLRYHPRILPARRHWVEVGVTHTYLSPAGGKARSADRPTRPRPWRSCEEDLRTPRSRARRAGGAL